MPSGCRVLNVLRFENHKNWNKHSERKEQLRALCSEACENFQTATTAPQIDAEFPLNVTLEKQLNECFLFHGTGPDAAEKIAEDSFCLEEASSSTDTMLGSGIYLAEHASKSDEYAKDGTGVYHGQYALLICRALLGRVKVAESVGDASHHVRGHFDSVCGDRKKVVGIFRELVLFDESMVHPEFIVLYTRLTDI